MPRPKPEHPKKTVTIRLGEGLIELINDHAKANGLKVNGAYEQLLWLGIGRSPIPDEAKQAAE